MRAGAQKLHERVELQGGYNKAYIRRIAVFPRGASTLCSIFRHSRQAWHSGRIPPSTTAEPIFPGGNGSYRAWQAGLACGSGRTLPPPEQELALGGHSCRRRRPTRTAGQRCDGGMLGELVEEAPRRAARARPGGQLCDGRQLPGDLEARSPCRELRTLSRATERQCFDTGSEHRCNRAGSTHARH